MTSIDPNPSYRVQLRDDRPPLTQPAMSNDVDRHSRVRLTSRWMEINGRPAIPVAGELHFSRVQRERWEEELRLLVASGITMVSTYMFWIHHEPERGQISFEDNLDVAAFLGAAERVGLDVILRIGPWCHGEVRNGGFPDWVLEAAPHSRTNDPDYLRLAEGWYASVAEQVRSFCGPDGRIVGIQLENELYDQPEHIATLKKLARKVGFSAPLWTATGWGGAILPEHEVFPLYSGYADGFWADQGSVWDDSFRDHFTFTHVWDDPGVGGDQREEGVEILVRPVDPEFPPATCELGGGMATAYHRRPLARGRDIAAVANTKIGNGSLWQGFYMYAGGTNPVDHVQESHSTGYPNDLPRFDYDFQAAVGSTGRPGSGLALFREHNAFLAAFGERLADMYSSLPDGAPVSVHDLRTLRWAVRSDGTQGVVFINTHQPYEPLAAAEGVQLTIATADGARVIPDRPIDIPSGLIARWPLGLDIAGVTIDWATASLAGLIDGPIPTLVLHAHDGVEPRIMFAGLEASPRDLVVGETFVVSDSLRILVIDDAQAERLWYFPSELIDSAEAVWFEEGSLVVRASSTPDVRRWVDGNWVAVEVATDSLPQTTSLPFQQVAGAGDAPSRYGEFAGRSSAPTDEQFDAVAGVWRIARPLTSALNDGDRVEIVIDFDGDVAQLRADGELFADKFWDGLVWRVDISHIPADRELTLHISPIASQSVIDLDPGARARVDAAGSLCAIRTVEQVTSVRWSPTSW
ncbi:beta-galactosidase [Lacisediminihabitans changchengi]|uniref:Beta-galactosidase n=1 Tax=Lacisediminihabitans changchengi TaxID=2787634 RepID=A0A934SN83_9MICO|nr:beta-galactosidase [Lacisediminihabitans changchengi]MBK4348643.1 beta-galactosidase [Lacisediminihabitans changchengi]